MSQNGFRLDVAGRLYSGEVEGVVRAGYAKLFAGLGVTLDAFDPVSLVLFPEMDAKVDVPEGARLRLKRGADGRLALEVERAA